MIPILTFLLGLLVSPAQAQNIQCPTRPVGDSSNACASTAFVQQNASSGVVNLIADTTGTVPLDMPMVAALATGKNVHIPSGTYTLNNWIDMTVPGQRVYCDGPATTITAKRTTADGHLTGLLLSNGGSGFTGTATVSFSGGGGTGATAAATVSGGTVTSLTLTNAGIGYTSSPIVTVTGTGGSGVQASAYAGYNPSPMLVIEPTAVDAQFMGCSLDHNGAQYLATGPFIPLTWNTAAVDNSGTPQKANNDGLGNAVLIMADRAKILDTNITRGWDNCVGVALFNFTTAAQTGTKPSAAVYDRNTSSYCGVGQHFSNPNYNQGAGVDSLTAAGTIISNSEDWYSYNGFWVDTSGGGSAQMSNLTSWYAQISPTIVSAGWPFTLGGNGFYLSGSNINFDGSGGSLSQALVGTSCANCTAVMPQQQGMIIDTHSNGTIVTNFKAVRPGQQGIWAQSGQTRFVNTYIDSPNFLKGYTGIAPGTAAPQTSAVQVDASATAGVTAQFQNTLVNFVGLTIFNTGTLNYSYAIGEGSYGGATPNVTITDPNITAGTAGFYFPAGSGQIKTLDPQSINGTSATTVNLQGTGTISLSHVIANAAAPTITSGFGTGSSVISWNGSKAFRVNVGTGGTASSGVVGFNAVLGGPASCSAVDVTNPVNANRVVAVGTSSQVTLTNVNASGAATVWAASDIISVSCDGG